jgi:uncharacterized protein (DUF2267 family)
MPAIDPGTETVAVSLSMFRDFYASLWTRREGCRVIGDEKRVEFLHWVAQASGRHPDDLSDRLGAVFQALFDEIEREMAPIRSGNLDPRYVRLFLLKP